MKKLRKVLAVVFMATMMTVSASFAGMAETAVETVSEESYDVSENNASDANSAQSETGSDSSTDGSFETTDKTVDENDSVEFDEEETPEVEKEHAEEVETSASSDTVVEVTGKGDVSVSVDEIVIEKNNNEIIISSDSEIVVETPEYNSSLITEKDSDLENDIQFETTSKVVDDVDIVEFDEEPIENEVIVTPDVPEEDVPSDLPPEIVVPEDPEPVVPEPEVPVNPEPEKPEVPVEPEKPEPEKPHVDHNDHDDNDDHDEPKNYEVTVYSNQEPFIPLFLNEPSPGLTVKPVFVDEPAPSALPKTGDSTPVSGYVFVLSLIALVVACLLGGNEEGCQTGSLFYVQAAGTNYNGINSDRSVHMIKEESVCRMYVCSLTKLYSVFGKLLHLLRI